MRGSAAAVLLSLLLAVPSASAQCNFTATYSGQFRASYRDAVIDGNDLWAATGYGLQLFDRTVDPPSLKASLAIPFATTLVRVSSGMAYAVSGTRVYAVRKTGSSIHVLGSVDTGASINDLLATTTHLYAATSTGIQQFDLLDPARPVRTAAVFATSSPSVTSLSLAGTTLFAADSDSSVAMFSLLIPTLPANGGTLQSLARSTSVKTTASRIYISDGQNTDVFVAGGVAATKVATVPFGTTAFATLTGDVVFAAGSDRRWRAIDWTNAATPVELFATDILPNGGTINRVAALQTAANRLYIAAGDAGLLSWDTTNFAAPFPVRNYRIGATTSARWVDGKLYVSSAAGSIRELTRGSSGTLTAARQWDSRQHTLYDGANGFLLSSTAALLTYWTLNPATPGLVSSAQFKTLIRSAIAVETTAYVILNDGSLWSSDLGQVSAQPRPIALNDFSASSIAHSGSSIAIAGYRSDGTLVVSYFATPDFSQTPVTVPVQGVATTNLALAGSTAAIFTFRGINLIDFTNGSVSAIQEARTDIAHSLAFAGNRILELSDTAVTLWNLSSGSSIRTFPLPANTNGVLAADQMAAVTTDTGVTGVVFDSTVPAPKLDATLSGNTYYKKIAASGDRLYIFDGRGVDIFTTTFGAAPHYLSSARPLGIIDFAISDRALFTLSGSGVVTALTREGVATSQITLNEGANVQPLAIGSAGGAVWVSISKGCAVGACQKQTIIFEPQSLVRTAAFDGAVADLASSTTRAYAIFDLPSEIRVYNITDAFHPSPVATRATEGSTPPVSVTRADGTVYVLGDKLYAYSEDALTKTGEQLASYQADTTGAAYVDQRVRIDGNCGFISGRGAAPQLFALPQWTPASAPAVPSLVRSVASTSGRLYLLTDDSVELWSVQTPPGEPRRRPAR